MTMMSSGDVSVGVAELKRRFSEYLDRVLHRGARVTVRRRGRDVAALVPADEVRAAPAQPRRGLIAAAGAWEDVDELDGLVRDVYRARRRAKDRDVPRL
jgi:prevent-host-death family protein